MNYSSALKKLVILVFFSFFVVNSVVLAVDNLDLPGESAEPPKMEIVEQPKEAVGDDVISDTKDDNVVKDVDKSDAVNSDDVAKDKEDGAKEKDDKKIDDSVVEDVPEAQAMSAISNGANNQSPTDNQYINSSTIKQLIPKADKSVGALTYEFPITIPDGRNGFQPELRLSYSSQTKEMQNLFGYGWRISIPTIEIINKKGVQRMYTDNYYSSSFSGELMSIGNNNYVSKVEDGSYLRYQFDGSTWIVIAKDGLTYTFGVKQDSSDGLKVAKWYVSEIRDKNSNYIKYEYFKDNGQVYPSKITYTGNGSTDGIYTVEFLRQSRTDNLAIYSFGFPIKSDYIINEIDIKVSGVLAKKYVITYDEGDNGKRLILQNIVETGTDGLGVSISKNPVVFDYLQNNVSWVNNQTYQLPSDITLFNSTSETGEVSKNGIEIIDINGDGLVDFIGSTTTVNYNSYCVNRRDDCANVITNNFYINQGNGTWQIDNTWQMPLDSPGYDSYYNRYYTEIPITLYSNSSGLNPTSYSQTIYKLIDVNGDGLPDIVKNRAQVNWNQYMFGAGVWLNNGHGWDYSSSYQIPIANDQFACFATVTTGTNGPLYSPCPNKTETVDINGDGLVDFIESYVKVNNYDFSNLTQNSLLHGFVNRIYLNQGDGTWQLSSWTMPNDTRITAYQFSQGEITSSVAITLSDLVYSSNQYNCGDKTPGSYTCTYAGDYELFSPVSSGYRLVDVNGDGLPDIVKAIKISKTEPTSITQMPDEYQTGVWINNGSNGFVKDDSYVFPATTQSPYVTPYFTARTFSYVAYSQYNPYGPSGYRKRVFIDGSERVQIVDINGDGLIDFLDSRYVSGGDSCPTQTVNDFYISQGDKTWVKNTNYQLPQSSACYGTSLIGGSVSYQSPCNQSPVAFFSGGGDNGDGIIKNFSPYRLVDLDGDGLQDIVQSLSQRFNTTTLWKRAIWINNGNQSDLIRRITNEQGGKTDIEYKSTVDYRKSDNTIGNPRLPFSINTVSSVSNDDGMGNISNETYGYYDGSFYTSSIFDRKFAGFNLITKTNANSVSKTYYHQGNTTDSTKGEYSDHVSKIGKVYRIEIYDTNNNLYVKNINKWENYNLLNGRNFVKLTDKVDFAYDGNTTHKDKAYTYVYDDSNGNLYSSREWGEVNANDDGTFTDVGTDKYLTNYSYAYSTMRLPSQISVFDASNNKVKEVRYYYDDMALGQFGGFGRLTKTENLINGTDYTSTENVYNSYGLVTQKKDGRSKVTTYLYDSYNLYPVTITNPLNQQNNFLYDYSCSKVKQSTDSNNMVFKTTFDGLCRVVEEKQPDQSNPSIFTVKTSYIYTNQPIGVLTKKTDYLDSTNGVDTYTYTDGFDRAIQTRKEATGTNNYIVNDVVYNNLEQINKSSLPYFGTGFSKTTATTNNALYSIYSYDPLLRISGISNAVGNNTNVYDDWKITRTDARGKQKILYSDAYDNLARVDEINSGSTYSTNYAYDYNNKLTKITDALGNIRNIVYDKIGRMISSQDLHALASTVFGTWTYLYDNASNLISVTDPKNKVLVSTYDNVNNKLTDTYDGILVGSYVYGGCNNGVGRLCTSQTGNTTKQYVYNPLGLVGAETVTIDQSNDFPYVNYPTSYTYDYQGNKLVITNPDSSRVKYGYANSGNINRVQYSSAGATTYADIISSFTYNPLNSIVTALFANGISISNTYSQAYLYRLTNRTTKNSLNTKYQNIGYLYDNNGNITRITDNSGTNAKKIANYTYDDLNRLTKAVITNTNNSSNYTENYTYSAIGNILSKTGQGTYVYPTVDGNPQAVSSIGSNNYLYDLNGNLSSGNGWTYSWDYRNRLLGATNGTDTATYSYDGDYNRMVANNNGSLTFYPSAGFEISGQGLTKNIFANGLLVSTITNSVGTEAVPSVENIYYVHTDHLTGSNVVTNSTGAIEQVLDYSPFGSIKLNEKTSTFDEKRKYAGNIHDDAIGLDYMLARYYNSSIGKFLSIDSELLNNPQRFITDPQQLNGYSYARNNPLAYVDKTGKNPLLIIALTSPEILAFIAFDITMLANDSYQMGRAIAEGNVSSVGDYAMRSMVDAVGLGAVNISMKTANSESKMASSESKSTADLLQEFANKADQSVQGSGRVAGTLKHSELARQIRGSKNDSLGAEVTFKDGLPADYGTKGAVRLDAVEYGSNKSIIKAVYDYKTGNACLTDKRIQQIQGHLPNFAPVYQLKPKK